MSNKHILTIVLVAVALIVGIFVLKSAMGVCDAQEWIVVQPLMGEVYIQ